MNLYTLYGWLDGWMVGWMDGWLDDFWMGQQNSEHHSRARTHPYCFETVRQTCRCRCWSGDDVVWQIDQIAQVGAEMVG